VFIRKNCNFMSIDCFVAAIIVEQSLSVEDKVLLAQAATERAAIVAKYDKVCVTVLNSLESFCI